MEEKGLPTGFLIIAAIIALIVIGSANGTETEDVSSSNNETISEKTITVTTEVTSAKEEEVNLDISENIEIGNITMPTSAYDYKYKNYQDVISDLNKLGFTNIKTEVVYDVFFGFLISEGESDKITINGISDFKEGDTFSTDAEIVITYHLSYTDDPDYEATNTSNVTTEAPKSLYYSTNDLETAKNGNSGVFSYKSKGKEYSIYYIIDFDEEYVYRFIEGNGDKTCERLKMDSGDLNSVLIVTYHDGDDSWQNGLHFKWKNQPDHLVLEDNFGFETDLYSTNLSDALSIKINKTIIDY